ncbi:Anthranilate synthase component 1 [uncultured archaeon]|nr:Anthranilate synthase component 1 [uncultured archaeon]
MAYSSATRPLGKETPYSLFKRISGGRPYCFLLESAKGGRRTYLGAEIKRVVREKEGKAEVYEGGRWRVVPGGWEAFLRKNAGRKAAGKSGGFSGGFVGYFSYDLVRGWVNFSGNSADDLSLPTAYLMEPSSWITIDHVGNTATAYAATQADAKSLIECAFKGPLPSEGKHAASSDLLSSFSKEGFKKAVIKTKKYIAAGDIFQANISQRFSVGFNGDTLSLYRRLTEINPSPYACYIRFPELTLVSSSPELLAKVRGNSIETRPIAGTRPRGATKKEDTRLSAELLLSQKERAEHIMLVDLERNDLGRVCNYGSVKVDELMVLERYSHVIHIVSHVSGKLREGVDAVDILRAVFPGGTITGCPKVRCMEIIDELEPVRRGPYTGSAGWIGYNGDMELNIIIRTILVADKRAYFQTGAGIVADSDPEFEFHETLHKAEALQKALKTEFKEEKRKD